MSRKLSNMSGVRCNGIAIGTYARNIVEEFVQDKNFYNDHQIIKSAVVIAKDLVNKNKHKEELL